MEKRTVKTSLLVTIEDENGNNVEEHSFINKTKIEHIDKLESDSYINILINNSRDFINSLALNNVANNKKIQEVYGPSVVNVDNNEFNALVKEIGADDKNQTLLDNEEIINEVIPTTKSFDDRIITGLTNAYIFKDTEALVPKNTFKINLNVVKFKCMDKDLIIYVFRETRNCESYSFISNERIPIDYYMDEKDNIVNFHASDNHKEFNGAFSKKHMFFSSEIGTDNILEFIPTEEHIYTHIIPNIINLETNSNLAKFRVEIGSNVISDFNRDDYISNVWLKMEGKK